MARAAGVDQRVALPAEPDDAAMLDLLRQWDDAGRPDAPTVIVRH